MSKLAGNDLMKDMEFLINELHKEWDRSGATKATVIIGIEEASEVNQTLAAKIVEKQELLEKDELSFKQSIGLSRENYVLLRLVKKIKAKEDKTNEKGLDMEFSVPLDCQTANYNRVQQQIKIPSDTYQTARSCL